MRRYLLYMFVNSGFVTIILFGALMFFLLNLLHAGGGNSGFG